MIGTGTMTSATRSIGILFFLLLTLVLPVRAAELAIGRFGVEGLKGWDVKEYQGRTTYQLVQEDGRTVVKAHAKAAASGLIKKITFDPARYRYLTWSWKIAGIIEHGDDKPTTGHDFPARVYVIFPGRFFWQTRAIDYVWANKLRKDEVFPSVVTSKVMMLAVESGPAQAGQWLREKRDILADYRRLFGEEPREAGAIAIMTDTDDTGSEATAWYGDITVTREP